MARPLYRTAPSRHSPQGRPRGRRHKHQAAEDGQGSIDSAARSLERRNATLGSWSALDLRAERQWRDLQHRAFPGRVDAGDADAGGAHQARRLHLPWITRVERGEIARGGLRRPGDQVDHRHVVGDDHAVQPLRGSASVGEGGDPPTRTKQDVNEDWKTWQILENAI